MINQLIANPVWGWMFGGLLMTSGAVLLLLVLRGRRRVRRVRLARIAAHRAARFDPARIPAPVLSDDTAVLYVVQPVDVTALMPRQRVGGDVR